MSTAILGAWPRRPRERHGDILPEAARPEPGWSEGLDADDLRGGEPANHDLSGMTDHHHGSPQDDLGARFDGDGIGFNVLGLSPALGAVGHSEGGQGRLHMLGLTLVPNPARRR